MVHKLAVEASSNMTISVMASGIGPAAMVTLSFGADNELESDFGQKLRGK
jgi:hypothetical protein